MIYEQILRHHAVFSLLTAFLLDFLLADPYFFPHPVRLMGKIIDFLEKSLLNLQNPPKIQKIKGFVLVILVLLATFICSLALLFFSKRIHPILFLALEVIMIYQCIAAKSLYSESMKVYKKLKNNDLQGARRAVSMIVGRDTDILDEKGVARASVETVAESTNDGVIAPIFYIAFFGPIGGMVYKAINTMDSMIAYKNEKYLHFGFFAAKLDDAANFLPARLSAVLMLLTSFVLPGFSGKNALKIFLRDRLKHASPNSAQTESVAAGALGLRLAGDTIYGGIVEKKDFIGDKLREVDYKDIFRSNILMYGATVCMIILCTVLLTIMRILST